MRIKTQKDVERAVKCNGNHSYGKGLFLAVRGGSTLWMYRYSDHGKVRQISLGKYPDISLKGAELAAASKRLNYKNGIDPKPVSKPLGNTFRVDAERYYNHTKGKWQSDQYRRDWWLSLERHILPHIGDRLTSLLSVNDILSVIQPHWGVLVKSDLLLDRIRLIINHAISVDDDDKFPMGNPADKVKNRLPVLHKVVQPHGALPWQQLPELFRKLESIDSTESKCLQFLLLTCTPRSAEILGARWDEIVSNNFNVPGIRMKSRKARTIPLSDKAVKLLQTIPRTCDLIFGLDTNRMRRLLQSIVGTEYNCHGLRSSFRDWIEENRTQLYDIEAAEQCLDHTIHSQVVRAYRRSELLEQRRDLAERFAAFLTSSS